MLVALLVTGAAAGPSVLPIPGTSLKLGMPMARADSLAHLRPLPGAANRRKGDAKFFGLDAETEADFVAGQLEHVHFVVPGASTHSRDYIEDQLRNTGLRRECQSFDARAHDCVWTSRVALRVVWTAARLTADATRAEGEPRPEANAELDSVHVAIADSLHANTLGAGASPVGTPGAGSLLSAAPMLADTLSLSGPFSPASKIQPEVIGVRPSILYPPGAVSAGIQGTVLVLATVDTSGTVIETAVVRSIPELNEEALKAARKFRFVPLIADGRATGFRVVIPFRFAIH